MRLIAFLIVLVGAARVADAYPQFQLALGADRCSACHFSPGGGGLLNAYGRNEAGETISRDGDGRFLHGAWEPPSWLALGADLRLAGALKYQSQEREYLAFPMQTDIYVRAAKQGLSANVTLGLRGGARAPQPRLVERLVSREHYVMYEHEGGLYARAGRFFPVFGLRSQDHTAYVRRYLGFHTLEEPYGAAAGYFGKRWEAHVSAFVPRPAELLGAGVKARGIAAYHERRFLDDGAAIAVQARYASSDTEARATVGLVGKRWFPGAGVLLLGELDLQRQAFADGIGPTRYQLAAFAGASKMLVRGIMAGVAVHRWQPDLRQRSARDAVQLDLQMFVRAHVELHLLTRVAGSGDFEDPGLLSMLQVHYYL